MAEVFVVVFDVHIQHVQRVAYLSEGIVGKYTFQFHRRIKQDICSDILLLAFVIGQRQIRFQFFFHYQMKPILKPYCSFDVVSQLSLVP